MQIPTERTTPKGELLIFTLREEARRLGLPDLEEATDEDLEKLIHLFPEEEQRDAEESVKGEDFTKEEFLVAMLRHIVDSHRPSKS